MIKQADNKISAPVDLKESRWKGISSTEARNSAIVDLKGMLNAKSVEDFDNIRKGYKVKYCQHHEWLNYIRSTWMTHSDKKLKCNREVGTQI